MDESPSPSLPERLATPEERDHAVARCSTAFARDVLSLEEYERRLAAIYRATTNRQLEALIGDLPGEGPHGGPPDARTLLSPLVDTLFGNVERRGPAVVPARLQVRATFGNIELDLREAHFGTGVTEIEIRAVFGNVEITLPDDIAVDNHGSAILGSFTCGAGAWDASRRVRISGLAALGNVEVTSAARTLPSK